MFVCLLVCLLVAAGLHQRSFGSFILGIVTRLQMIGEELCVRCWSWPGPPRSSGTWNDLRVCWGPQLRRSTLKRAGFPTLFAWAQPRLCCRRWWAEAGVVVTLHPLPPPGLHTTTPPAHPASWLTLGDSNQRAWPGVPDSQGNAWSTAWLLGCVSVCFLRGPRTLGGSVVGAGGVSPGRGPWGSLSPLGSRVLFPGRGVSPSSQEGKPFIFPPLC